MINPDPRMIAQLNLLSDLIGNSTGGDSSRSGLVKLSLFDEEDDDDNGPPLVIFLILKCVFLYTFVFIRIQKRPQASTSNQRPRNEDITIDASKVSISFK